jgi:Flp pilus assembly protein TadD
MRALRSFFVAGLVLAGLLIASPAGAQATFEFVGKVADRDGKPVIGVKLQIVNQANAASVRDGASDKRGNFWISGVPYSQQHRLFTISVQTPDTAIWKVKVVGRAGDRTIYDEFEKDLHGTTQQFDMRVLGAGELRAELVVGPPAEVAPVAGAPGTAPAESTDPLTLAQEKARAGDYEGAAAILQEAVTQAPDDAERREWYATVLLRLGRAGEAQTQAMKAVQAAPDRVGARIVLADAQYQIGQVDRARETLAEARRIAPTDVKVARRHAVIAAESGRPTEAIESWRVIVDAKPDDAEAWMSLGDLYAQAGESAKSEAAYNKVTELDPEHAYRTYFNLGAVIENRDNLSEADNRKAADAFRKAIEIKPDYALAYRHLGYTLLRSGDLPGAKKALQKYLELDPKASDAGEIRSTVKSLP